MSLISTIITNYNYEKYIADAIQSVLNQTYNNYEIIIVDDGSTDHSLDIIYEYKQNYPDVIKVIEQENSGQAVAFNNAFKLARGEIIAFLDADDYWYSNKLEKIAKYHQTYPAIQHNLNVNNKEKITILEDQVQKQQYAWENYNFGGYVPTSGLSFVKDVVAFVFPIQDNGFKVCADWYLKCMFLNEFDIFSLNESLGCYRAHESNNWYESQEKYKAYGDFILEQTNLYRRKKGKRLLSLDSGKNIKEYLYSSLKLNKTDRYVIFGTGQQGKYFYQRMKDDYDVIGFTNSLSKKSFEFEGLICTPLEEVLTNTRQDDKILIASDSLGEIEYLLREMGVAQNRIISPQL
ncbi:glycosyltransferase involved in cell wall bisynthesis [Ureibacillus xyleni]|uniref:Glycosyltransferase involved in cell wall bisynthesis n=1 Tax=Ureibacillus xyleni TaxID=614648 RepID=A0A285RFT9_9BACL|nr:glycosyltransferase family A protein [Ureibacillus xyleni]SOB91247.1 glycosyltransferase involved in cell wall bisynthesis [Ureibacillus xyleni]